MVLSIGDTVEEVTDTGILATSSTLAVSALGDDDDGSLIQIHPSGVRHVRGNNKGVNEWRAPGRKKITACACNRSQAIVALTGGELVYFELDEAGQLLEIEKIETSSEVVSVDIPPIPDGSLRAKFAAVAGYDSTVRVLSLNPGEALRTVGVQATPSPPESVLLLEVNNKTTKNKKASSSAPPSMFLNVGLSNGILVRCEVDRVSGALSDARSRFVGQRPRETQSHRNERRVWIRSFIHANRGWASTKTVDFQSSQHVTKPSTARVASLRNKFLKVSLRSWMEVYGF